MTRVRQLSAFGAAVLRSLIRDPQALFFMLVLPVVVIIVVGTTFGGQSGLELGMVEPGSELEAGLQDSFEQRDGIELRLYDTEEELDDAVRHFRVDGGVVVESRPTGSAASAATPVRIRVITAGAGEQVLAVRTAVDGAAASLSARLAAVALVTELTGATADEATEVATALPLGPTRVEAVDTEVADAAETSQYARVVPQNLVLFTFINALASSTFLVRSRRDGVLHRARSAPAPIAVQLGGLVLGWLAVTVVQSALIVGFGVVLFDVPFGDPLAAGLLTLSWAVFGCGAGLLVGALGRNEDRVGALSPVIGLVLGALGGCMIPFEIFPAVMRKIALAIPHAWAMTGWENVVFERGGVTDIAGSLAVIGVWAVATIAIATLVLRRQLDR